MKPTTKYANHTKGPTAWFLSHAECSGIPWFSKVFQAYPRQIKANQGRQPFHEQFAEWWVAE